MSRNVTTGVARDKQELAFQLTDFDRIAFIDQVRDTRRSGFVPFMAIHFEIWVFLDKFFIAADMVPVVVGVDNCREIYPLAFNGFSNRLCL